MRHFEGFDVPDRTWEQILYQKRIDGYAERPFWEWIVYHFGNVETGGGVKAQMQRVTRQEYLAMWMGNLAQNLPYIRRTNFWNLRTLKREMEEQPHSPYCVILGRGPSMFRKNHIEMIRDSAFYKSSDLWVVATDGALKECLKRHLVPDFVVCVDGSDVCKKWFTGIDATSKSLLRGKIAVVNVEVSPLVVRAIRRIGMKIYWFVPNHDDVNSFTSLTRIIINLARTKSLPEGLVSIDCGSCVGNTAYNLSWNILGFKEICLVGMDAGYPADMPKDETYYWGGMLESGLNGVQASATFEHFRNPFTGEDYVLDPVFSSYRDTFLEYAILKPDDVNIYNASSGTIYRPPLIQSVHLEEWLEMVD